MKIVQDTDKAISMMHGVALWMEKNGMHVTQWWQPQNMNREFLLKHAGSNEFYVGLEGDKPVASVILQDSERNQSWKSVDGDTSQKALYIHWLCVARDFSGQGYSKSMVDFSAEKARKKGFKLLRLDTDANEKKLCELYEELGFERVGTELSGEHKTAFYQKELE